MNDQDSFFDKVHLIARQIPSGRITSYGAIGKYLGLASSARMVGWAMNSSHIAKPPVPAQRVVNRNGLLTGKHHFATPTRMQELLENEGIEVTDDQVQNFEKVFWNPMKELDPL